MAGIPASQFFGGSSSPTAPAIASPQSMSANDFFGGANTSSQGQSTGFLGTSPTDNLYGKIINNSITRGIQSAFPASAALGQDIGTLGGFAATKIGDLIHGTNNASQYDLSAPKPVQAIGDAALMVGQGAMGGVPPELAAAVPGLEAAEPLGSSIFTGGGAANVAGRIGVQGVLGAGMGAAGALAGGNTSASGIAKNALLGAGISGGVAGAGELGSALVSSMSNNSGASRLMDKTNDLSTLKRAFNNASTATTDPISTMDQNNLIKDLRVVDGKIDVSGITNPGRTGSLDNLIDQQQQMGTQAVAGMQGGIPTTDFKDQVIGAIKNNSNLKAAGKIASTTNEISKMFDDYQSSYGDTIPYKDVNDIRVAMNKQFNPDTWDAEKAIGNAARGVLYNAADDTTALANGGGVMSTGSKGANAATLKSAMQNEQELINAKEFMNTLDTKAVKGGRLGKMFAGVIGSGVGAAVGSAAGPFGTIAGSVAGDVAANKAMGFAQSNYFNPISGRAGNSLKNFISSPAATNAVGYLKGVGMTPVLKAAGKP